MKRLILALALLLVFSTTNAFAATHAAGGLGFHRSVAPLGFRWWLGASQKVGLDAGVGFDTDEVDDEETLDPDDTTSLLDTAVDLGIPILVKSWDRAHFLFRPGLLWISDQEFVADEKERGSRIIISAELEAEVFIVDEVSVSASHGIAIDIDDPPGTAESTTEFSSLGNDFTTIGFHVYLLGGE